MIALALEFSASRRSVAVLDLPEPPATAPARLLGQAQEITPRSLQPLALFQSALTQARVDRDTVEGIVVGLGPGSYTGIRSAIALAQGWQLAREVKLLGVSTVDALAWQAQESGGAGGVWIGIDAQRHEFYLAGYRLAEGIRHRTEQLRLATASELEQIAAQGKLFGPGLKKWFANATDLEPRAAVVGLLAAGRTDFLAGAKLEPIYLRETAFVKASPPRRS
jgi:tRNA threonylcarbamoyl adenosine modification protein YeaZ